MTMRVRNSATQEIKRKFLLADPLNWHVHPQSQRDALAAIFQEIGFVGHVLVRPARGKRNRWYIVDGHERAEHFGPNDPVPCCVLDIDEDEARKLLLSYDPLGYMSEVDHDALDRLRGQVTFELDGLDDTIAGTLSNFGPPDDHGSADLESDPGGKDDVPEPPDDPTTRPGDLWILGDHRLLCGDSAHPADVDRLLGGAEIHLVNTDPPYNVKVEPRSNNAIAAGNSSFSGGEDGKRRRGKKGDLKHHQSLDLARHPSKAKGTTKKMRAKDRPLENDFVTDERFEELLAAWFGNMARVLRPGRSFYIWGGYANCANYPPVLKATGLKFSQAVIWVKEHPVLTRKDFMGNHEWCFYGWREGAAHKFYGPNNAVDVWSIKKVNPQSMVHLTEKPVALAERAIEYSSRPREHVLDLFGGSGSTLIGCEQAGRKAFLMELDPAYCDVIVERWEQLTGGKAQRQAAKEAA